MNTAPTAMTSQSQTLKPSFTPFRDGEGDDQGERGDERPISKARMRLGHVVLPLVVRVGRSSASSVASSTNGRCSRCGYAAWIGCGYTPT